MEKIKTKKTIWVCTNCENWCIRKKAPEAYTCLLREPYFQKTTVSFSTPLNKVIKTGQPVLVGANKTPRLFSHFDEDGCLCTFSGQLPRGTWREHEWTLPSRERLKTIGHANLGWLAAEDLEDDHSEE